MGERGPKKGAKYKKQNSNVVIPKEASLKKFVEKASQHKFLGQLEGTAPNLDAFKEMPSEPFQSIVDNISPENKTEEKTAAPKLPPVQENIKEEAEAFLSGTFEMGAGLMSIPDFALSIEEKLAATPSFIPIYLKYIKPKMGDNAELFVFGMVMMGVVGKRIPMVQKKLAEKNRTAIQSEVRNATNEINKAPVQQTV